MGAAEDGEGGLVVFKDVDRKRAGREFGREV